jgi:thiosulfate/3-mercaptopyruvate sulfurtransferase
MMTLVGALLVAAPVMITAEEAKGLAGKPDVVFLCSDSEKDCAKESIPGSAFAYSHDLQFLDDVKSCQGLPMCEAHAAKVFGALGIGQGTRVIAYDSGIGVNASGNWFLLQLYGHDAVQILDGGIATWKAKGGKTASGPAAKIAPKTFTPKVRREMIATVAEVKKATADPAGYLIVDARHNLDEYTGKTLQASMKSPDEEVTVPRGGHIPKAVFSPWTKYAGNKLGKPNKPTLRDPADLKKQLEKLKKNGYAPEKTVISYCHVGLGRGSFQYLALKEAGHQNVKLYVGSWAEWGSDPSLPLGDRP